MASRAASSSTPNRVTIAIAGVVMQVALGAVYAWSVFTGPLEEIYTGASNTAINITFSIAIFALGFAAFAGGIWMRSSGPRVVAITAGVLYGGGVFLASFASSNLILLYLTYGLLGGIGIGLGYIVPVATLVKWFPDKRGFITGVAVAGFGAGALITAPLGGALARGIGVFPTFAVLGIIYLIAVVGAGLFMRNPPEGWSPGGNRVSSGSGQGQGQEVSVEFGSALRTWQWFGLWAILFLNVTAGIGLISEAAPMSQAIAGVGAGLAGILVGLISIGNGAGRFLWAWLSDAIGRRQVFMTMFLLQVVLFILLPFAGAFFFFALLSVIIVSCYGGGFGTMPAFTADYFGPADVGRIYGLMLTAWSFGGILGPVLISGILDLTGTYTAALYIYAVILLLSAAIPFVIRPPQIGGKGEAAASRAR